MSHLGQHSTLFSNEVHAVHGLTLTVGKRAVKQNLLTHGMRIPCHNWHMEIGDRIRLARMRAGLSQTQLAKAAGVTRGMVGQWEGEAKKKPGRETLVAVASATGVSVAYLLGQAENPLDQGPRMDADAITLMKLWHELSPRQKKSHLELFRASVALRRELEKEMAESETESAEDNRSPDQA